MQPHFSACDIWALSLVDARVSASYFESKVQKALSHTLYIEHLAQSSGYKIYSSECAKLNAKWRVSFRKDVSVRSTVHLNYWAAEGLSKRTIKACRWSAMCNTSATLIHWPSRSTLMIRRVRAISRGCPGYEKTGGNIPLSR